MSTVVDKKLEFSSYIFSHGSNFGSYSCYTHFTDDKTEAQRR